jgi:hypothetical protein
MRIARSTRRSPVKKFYRTTGRVNSPKEGVVKTGNRILSKALNSIDKVEKIRDGLSKEPVKTVLSVADSIAKSKKTPIGAGGLNLLPVDARTTAISGTAVGDITTSMSMFMYRPPRRSIPDTIQYQMKRVVSSGGIGSGTDAQSVYDCNILDAEPVSSNPNSDADYSRLTVRRAFDNYLEGSVFKGSTPISAKIQQSSIHVKSLTCELEITNLNSTAMFVDLYELVPQHNLGPTDYDTNDRQADGYMSPTWTFEQGLDGDVIFTDNSMPMTSIAANPFNSTVFSRTWKQVKHLRLNLTGNSIHRHKSVYSINKTVSYQEMAQFSTSGGKFAGWNPTYMFIQKGAPTSGNLAGTSALRYVANMQLNYEANPDRQAKVIVFDSDT